ncbi:unnamed protein product [Calypogeia fissa]
MCQQSVSLQIIKQCIKGFYDGSTYLPTSSTGCFCAQKEPGLGQTGFENMPARTSDYRQLDRNGNSFYPPEEMPQLPYSSPERNPCEFQKQSQVVFGKNSYISSGNSALEEFLYPADKLPYTAIERQPSGESVGFSRVDRTFSGFSDKYSHISSDGIYSSQEKTFAASPRDDSDLLSPALEQHPYAAVGYPASDRYSGPICRKASWPSDERNASQFGGFMERASSLESNSSGLGGGGSTTTMRRPFRGGSITERLSSSAVAFPTSSKDFLYNKANSTYGNSLDQISEGRSNSKHEAEEEGCRPYKIPEERYHSKEKVEGGDFPESELRSPASWAQQTEQGYNLQAALAVRLMAEAELISETRLIGQHFHETSCSAARRSVEATAHRFWVNGSLGYNDVVQDGFYHVWGMNPHVWTMCNHPQEGNKIPSLELLRAVDPADSSVEVVLVDKNGDSHLRELVRDMESKIKSLSRAHEDPDPQILAELLGTRVCNLLGGEAPHEHGDLLVRWKESSRSLKDCLSSIVLPLGSLSVGLCRHRALLFKTLAESIKLPCRIARGCKYCGLDDGASCMVLIEPDRECYVDLIAKPGCLSSPDSVWTNSSSSFCSPLRFQDFKSSFSGEDRSWSRSFGRQGGSLDSYCQEKRGDKGPRDWFPSGSAELTFSDDTPGAEVWAVMKVSEERAFNVFKDQLKDRRRDGKGPAKIMSSGNMSFVAGVNPDSMSLPKVDVVQASENVLNFQEEDPSARPARKSSVPTQATGHDRNLGMGQLEPSNAGRMVERMSSVEEWEIRWEDLIMKERVGAGSFGTVHRADWQGSDVAVKVLMEQDVHDERLNEFLREVSIMKRLRHPNVVLFMGAVTAPPNLSIVTEYLSRGSLFRLLHKSSIRELLDEKRRIRMAFDVAKGMNYLHRSNPPIVHRDLKSPNLLVDKNWTVKVCDFGLSRFKANAFLSSRSGAGTPEWMAPEILRDEPANEKSDVYSFGVVFWEIITMQLPWSGMSPAQVVGAVGFQSRRLQIPKDLHPEITATIEACWANDPRDRPSFASIMESLKEFLKTYAAQPPRVPSSKPVP